MKISQSSLTYLMRAGYMTLQIPQVTISFGEPATEPDVIEIPDNWIIETKHVGGLWMRNERLCVGRERGYWHLSPIGYAANRDAIKAAWEAADGLRRCADDRRANYRDPAEITWEAFEAWVQRWFEKIARTMEAEQAKAEERVRSLIAASARFELMRRA